MSVTPFSQASSARGTDRVQKTGATGVTKQLIISDLKSSAESMARASVHTYQKTLPSPLIKLKEHLHIKQTVASDASRGHDENLLLQASRSPTAIIHAKRPSKNSTLLLINESSVNQMRTASRPSRDL